MQKHISTREVCAAAGISEPALRHVLPRPGAPRPQLHPSAHLFLWTEHDVAALIRFIEQSRAERRIVAEEETLVS
jgi:hypothetical protein